MRRFSSNDGMYDDSTDGDYVQHSDAMVFVRRVEELRVFEQSSIKNAIRVVELEGLVRRAEVNRKAWKESALSKDARIAELEASVHERDEHLDLLQEELDAWIHTNAIDVLQRRIAELEAEACVDKALLTLADARLNREVLKTKGGV